jgi:hypothetical protein
MLKHLPRLLALCLVLPLPAWSATYYLDADTGNNGNTGTSEGAAWRNLSRANSHTFAPGDRLLLKRGQTFSGFLRINDRGNANNRILVGSYGPSPDPATIDATGQASAIDISGSEYIEIEDLRLVGAGIYNAVFSWTSPGQVWRHYHLRNLHIENTTTSGINFFVSNLGGYTYDGISISDCLLENIGGPGIQVNKWAGDSVLTVDGISGANAARVQGVYENVIAQNLSRPNIIPARFRITVSASGAISNVLVTEKGAGYRENDQLQVLDSQLGGGGAPNVTFRVDRLQPAEPNAFYHTDVLIRDNMILTSDGPGIQIGKVADALIEGNTVIDPGRDRTVGGSGIWTWYAGTPSTVFTVQNNTFIGSRGETDSLGAHVDIGCYNNIFQYNLTIDNEGGFQQILGKSENCVYRYNISINDGARINGVNGARLHGRTFYLGGYTGRNAPKIGPFNSYVYNNTIYVSADIVSKYDMEGSAEGALFANNIVYVAGTTEDISLEENPSGIIFDNNLVFENKIPATPWNTLQNTHVADPLFAEIGSLEASAYEALNRDAVVDQSIDLYLIPGDTAGVFGGFAVNEDFFGNPIIGQPDLGAIEAPESVHWLMANGFAGEQDMTEDINNDGVSLLAAFALGLDPEQNNSDQLPKLILNAPFQNVEMQFYGAANGVNYTIMESTDMDEWSPTDSAYLNGPFGDGTLQYSRPLNTIEERLFLQLMFELN